jgi:hypothetical protein
VVPENKRYANMQVMYHYSTPEATPQISSYAALGFFRTSPVDRVLTPFTTGCSTEVGSILAFLRTSPESSVCTLSAGGAGVAASGFLFFLTPITVTGVIVFAAGPADLSVYSLFPVTFQPHPEFPPKTAISSLHRFVAIAVEAREAKFC